ncbi:MAG: hypothetical protein LBT50_11340 [Prevotellaceae bacterium]|nr:hypothetical protein [Prevotellaceae bacterium]
MENRFALKENTYICAFFFKQYRYMNTLELEAQMAELARDILSETEEVVVQMLVIFFREMKKSVLPPPCRFTVEELKAEIAEAMDDVRCGRLTSQEELDKEMMLW